MSASQFEMSRKTLCFRLFSYLLSVRHVPNCAVSVYVNRAPDGVRRGVFLGYREPFSGIGARVGDTPQKEAPGYGVSLKKPLFIGVPGSL